jgi:hypothetical protein
MARDVLGEGSARGKEVAVGETAEGEEAERERERRKDGSYTGVYLDV